MAHNTYHHPEKKDSEQWLLSNEKLETNSYSKTKSNHKLQTWTWTAQILFFLLSLTLFIHGLQKSPVSPCQPQSGAMCKFSESENDIWKGY